MRIKNSIFNLFSLASRLLAERGLARFPLLGRLHQTFYAKFRPSGIVEAAICGLKLRIDAADPGIAPWLLTGKEFSPAEIRTLERYLKPGMVFVDVGANIGYFSLIAAQLVGPTGRVYAFEPDEENFKLLSQNIELNNFFWVTAIKKGVADKNGHAKFYRDPNNPCRHSLTPNSYEDMVTVEVTTLDNFFAEQTRVDLIKIDIEGAEPAVLRGMKKSLPVILNLFW